MPFLKREKIPPITIQSALTKGLISFTLTGAGGGDTSRVFLEIKNLSEAPIRIEIPQGTRFSEKGGV